MGAWEARSVGSAVRFCVGNDDVATALGETLTLAKQGEGRADARCIAQVKRKDCDRTVARGSLADMMRADEAGRGLACCFAFTGPRVGGKP